MTKSNHPFHLVDYSPWPLTMAAGLLTLTSGIIKWFHLYDKSLFKSYYMAMAVPPKHKYFCQPESQVSSTQWNK